MRTISLQFLFILLDNLPAGQSLLWDETTPFSLFIGSKLKSKQEHWPYFFYPDCQASLITQQWAVSTASCLTYSKIEKKYVRKDFVLWSDLRDVKFNFDAVQKIGTTDVVAHPTFNLGQWLDDFGLAKFSQAWNTSALLAAEPLPVHFSNWAGVSGRFTMFTPDGANLITVDLTATNNVGEFCTNLVPVTQVCVPIQQQDRKFLSNGINEGGGILVRWSGKTYMAGVYTAWHAREQNKFAMQFAGLAQYWMWMQKTIESHQG